MDWLTKSLRDANNGNNITRSTYNDNEYGYDGHWVDYAGHWVDYIF
jgi:hypothetical protein